ncbi:hypothetical protein NQ317_012799 [Molorchus minor]|uniref:Uncharacterized protein n=1 Tax=Molorchus minor TaxID=1323400 RepID=A0ABQ9K6H2_9CUCU|nr:hypothetical protein NQ317_012799 [Molorchus minor]
MALSYINTIKNQFLNPQEFLKKCCKICQQKNWWKY